MQLDAVREIMIGNRDIILTNIKAKLCLEYG